jgi:mono/diheme cytochrome c family protein
VSWRRVAAVLLGALFIAAAVVVALNLRDEDQGADSPSAAAIATRTPADLVARGEYLARAGDCIGCHSARGGVPYAGGRGIETPFGTVYAPNLTPDPETGLGRWSANDFWRALHNGRAPDGRLLYPVFPYPNYTRVVRADSDAMYAYLRSLPAVAQPNRPHELGFPFNLQAALAVWRALYFKPGVYVPDSARSAEWNRGAYLIEGLGHCNACHSSRNALGAPAGPLDLAGGLIPVQNWYAPSLTAADESSVADWDARDVVALLKTGVSARGAVLGPMSEVVLNSTQYLSDSDLAAMTTFLKALPANRAARPPAGPAPAIRTETQARGAALYEKHCVGCHGERGEGVAGAYPALAGSRAVTMASSANLVHVVLQGGFPPTTAGNPRPFGMPPFATTLADADVADLLSFIRSAWGNRAASVSALEVSRYRSDVRP